MTSHVYWNIDDDVMNDMPQNFFIRTFLRILNRILSFVNHIKRLKPDDDWLVAKKDYQGVIQWINIFLQIERKKTSGINEGERHWERQF